MKAPSPIAVCLGVIVGFLACSLVGRAHAGKGLFHHYLRLHPYLEQETSFFPTTSQLVAEARTECPPSSGRTLVVIGGNSVFNGSGQKRDQLWSRALQVELGDRFHVINFSAPGAGPMDNGAVVFEVLSRDYPSAVLVTNTEPGYYSAATQSAYSYLYWDAYYKGLLPPEARTLGQIVDSAEPPARRELKLGRRLNGLFYFNDLWTGVAYRYGSTIWTSWLRDRSFYPRRRLGDWYDKRPPVVADASEFEKMLPGHLESLRHRLSVDAGRFRQEQDGAWVQTEESLRHDREQIAALLPPPLPPRALIVLTPYNPWFLARLTDAERSRAQISFRNSVDLLGQDGFHVLPLLDRGFEPADFGDTVHLSPAGGERLAHLVADAVRAMSPDSFSPEAR